MITRRMVVSKTYYFDGTGKRFFDESYCKYETEKDYEQSLDEKVWLNLLKLEVCTVVPHIHCSVV
mgnify:CR=1 FL=1